HREGRRRHHRESRRRGWRDRQGRASGRGARGGGGRQDGHAGLRGRSRAHVAAARRASDTGVAVSRNLAYGVTTTRDPQTSTNDVFAYTDLVETGDIIGPRVLATGPGVFSSSGLDDKEATAAFVKRYKEAYKTDTIKQYVAGDRIVRQWIILAAKQ